MPIPRLPPRNAARIGCLAALRAVLACAAVGLALHAPATRAVGFGEVTVLSGLGHPLHAEIDLLVTSGERVEEACFRVDQRGSGDADIPRIMSAHLRVIDEGGRKRLVISTGNAIREPLMQIALRVGCGVDLVRELTLLFSPGDRAAAPPMPLVRSAPVARRASAPGAEGAPPLASGSAVRLAEAGGSVQTPRSMARALYPDNRRLQRRFADALIEANPGLDLFSDTPIPADAALVLPDMRKATALAGAPAAPAAPATPASSLPASATSVRGADGLAQATTLGAGTPRASTRQRQRRTADRVVVGGGADPSSVDDAIRPGLRLATELVSARSPIEAGSDDARGTEIMREMLRVEYRALIGPDRRGWAETDAAERRRLIRDSAAEYRRLADALEGIASPPPVPAPATAPVSAPAAGTGSLAPAAGGIASAPPGEDSTAPKPATPPPSAESLPPRPAPARAAAPARPPASAETPWYRDDVFLAAVLLAAVAGLALVFLRRRRELQRNYSYDDLVAADPADQAANSVFRPLIASEQGTEAAGEAPNPTADAASIFRTAAPSPSPSPAPPPAAASTPAEPPNPAATETAPPPPKVSPDPRRTGLDVEGLHVEHSRDDKAEDVIELADIMLAFGRVKGAVDLLGEFIANNPKNAVQPWIKLLDVYRENGMRPEFDQLAQRLNKTFNVQVQVWDAPADSGHRSLSLRDYPHAMSEIERLWGTQGGIHYLTSLIHDNRNGERLGFRREVAEEIIFLHDVLNLRLKSEPPR